MSSERVTDDTTTRTLYETPGVAATYREARALPDITIRLWIDAFSRAVEGLDVRLALDVGAGTGRFTTVLTAAVAGRVVAVEPIAEMVAVRETTAATFVRGIAELHRVLRPAGVVLLRTPTRETGDEFEWVRFFPESTQVNVGRMPARAEAIAAFAAAGFACREQRIVRQRIADNLAEYAARIRPRPFSSLRAMPDDVWVRRLAEFEAHCRTASDHPVDEPVEFFVFRRL